MQFLPEKNCSLLLGIFWPLNFVEVFTITSTRFLMKLCSLALVVPVEMLFGLLHFPRWQIWYITFVPN
jgi:hypothetical protein